MKAEELRIVSSIEEYISKIITYKEELPNLRIKYARIKNKKFSNDDRDYKYRVCSMTNNGVYYTVTINNILYKIFINEPISYKHLNLFMDDIPNTK